MTFHGHSDVKMNKKLRVKSLICIYRLSVCYRYGFQEFSYIVVLQKYLLANKDMAILAIIRPMSRQQKTKDRLCQNVEIGFLPSFSLPTAWGFWIQT